MSPASIAGAGLLKASPKRNHSPIKLRNSWQNDLEMGIIHPNVGAMESIRLLQE
jgi:hypothetical protein